MSVCTGELFSLNVSHAQGEFPGHDNRTWLVYMSVKATVCHTKKPISVYFFLTGEHLDGRKL